MDLTAPVTYTGDQSLNIQGNHSTISGASGSAGTTWDAGLFVSASDADLTIKNTNFADSFNNGVAVFLPASSNGTVTVTLSNVSVTGARFHGVFVDGQSSSGYNTDGDEHPTCVDPHPVDSPASIDLTVTQSHIDGNGTLTGGYDDSLATGCPRDFDGLRVDDGGEGSIVASLKRSTFDNNLADGAELDETGTGNVHARVTQSSFNSNGDSGATVDGLEDLDDGFDIDEADAGDIQASIFDTKLNANFDEGLDFDEAGDGDVNVSVRRTTADGNEDEGVKVDEEDAGNLSVDIRWVTATNSASQDGVQLGETGDGDISATIQQSTITGNDNFGVKAEQQDAGAGTLLIKNSDLSGNGNGAFDVDGVVETLANVTQ